MSSPCDDRYVSFPFPANLSHELIEDDDDHEAPARIVLLEGPADEARDPLKGYRRIELILSLVDNKFYIAGIKNGTRECVIKITDEQT